MDKFDSALDLLRRLPPRDTGVNLDSLCLLSPELTEDLLASVDKPLEVRTCKASGRAYLLCDYNRDGDSWRSPWSNTFEPPIPDGEVTLPSARVRDLEVRANEAMDVYRELYYDGGISSVYLWEYDSTLAGVMLFKNGISSSAARDGSWDSIHVFETTTRARKAHYKLTSTVILSLGSASKGRLAFENRADLGGYMTRQIEQDMAFKDDGDHIINVGKLVEEMELRMRNLLQEVYFGKVKDIFGELRSIDSMAHAEISRATHQEMLHSMIR